MTCDGGDRESTVTHPSVELGWKLTAELQQNKLPGQRAHGEGWRTDLEGSGRRVKEEAVSHGTCHPVGKANDIKVTAIKIGTEHCDLGYREQWDIKDHSPSPGKVFLSRK